MRRTLLPAALGATCAVGPALAEVDLPETFDHIGPSVETMTVSDGRTVAYVDTGPEGGAAVLFVGGTGTSAAAVGLTDFLRSMREDLGLRLISVGRAGFGQTDPAEDWGFEDFAEDATQILDALGVEDVAMLTISGGGPYSAAFAARDLGRIRSIHLAAATALAEPSGLCAMAPEERAEVLNDYAAHPLKWWAFPEESPTHDIPGFGTAAADDGARTFAIAGQKGDGAAEIAEVERYCTQPLPDVSMVEAPVYIYHGLKDTTVPPVHAERWAEVYPNVARERLYPEGGHGVQYRHWDQILVDMAGMADQLVVCREGTSELLPEAEGEAALKEGASLGICAWRR